MPDFSLAMTWTPADASEGCRYTFALTNDGATPLAQFSLAWSGPARVDSASTIENGSLVRRVSNFAQVAVPKDFVLQPGETWTFTVCGTSYPLRHWSDAALSAFIVTSNNKILPVALGVCRSTLAPDGEPKLGIDAPAPDAALEQGLAIVPWPADVSAEGERPAPAGLTLGAHPAGKAFGSLVEALFPDEDILRPGGLPVAFATDDGLAEDAYRLAIGENGASVTAAGVGSGALYGLVTLAQVLRGARLDPARCRFPRTARIEDAPAYGWRGTHLDVARQFYPTAELGTFLAVMAWNKLNRLHLHLTEDEAWRYEVTAFPELTRVGAFRGYGLALPPLLGSGPESYGGFYTKADLAELVRLAALYGIEVVPEIDVPGHSYAAIMSLPWLRDPGENAEYQSIQGFPNNCLNSAVPRTAAFIETVFEELLEIFPSRWIHVGADEVPDDAWSGSPLGRQRLEEIGGGGAHELQADFLKHLQATLTRAGRVTGAWEEGANGDGIAPEASYLVAWRKPEAGAALAAKGYDVVMSPGQAYYLDMALSEDWWEPGCSWAGTSSVENTYRFDPAAGLAAGDLHHLMGVQTCIWSEQMGDRRIFERLVFPRLSAMAETGWTPKASKSWTRFQAAAAFMPTLHG